MIPEEKGYFSALVSEAQAGTRYRFRLGEDSMLYPDPASRYQPDGPHGSSQVVDPTTFNWTDQNWKGVMVGSQVFCMKCILELFPGKERGKEPNKNF